LAEAAQLRARVVASGISPGAADWLLKGLSPASPVGVGCLIPDTSAAPVAVPENVVQTTISTALVTNWDCVIITPPTFPLLAIVVTGPAGTDFTAPWNTTPNVTVSVMQTEPATSALVNPFPVTQIVDITVPV